MKKNLVVVAGALALVAIVGFGSTYAYFTDKETTVNTVEMGHVDIKLDESKNGQDFVETGLSYTSVLPGDTLDKEVRISVAADSADVWVRVKVDAKWEDGTPVDTETEKLTYNIGEAWSLGEDGYYYYNSILAANDKVDLFTTVTVPLTWDNAKAGKHFTIDINAEAVQSANNANAVWPSSVEAYVPAVTE